MTGTRVMRHGDPQGVNVTVWLGDDPELGLVWADMDAWAEAHPCDCEGLCVCDTGDEA
jgi:hypothetical protein